MSKRLPKRGEPRRELIVRWLRAGLAFSQTNPRMGRMSSQSAPTATVALAQVLILYAATRGVPPPVFIERFGIDSDVLGNPDGRLPLTLFARIWRELSELCNDPDAALHAAECVPVDDATLVAHLFLVSPNLEAGIKRLLRFERVQHGEQLGELKILGDKAEITIYAERAVVRVPEPTSMFGAIMMIRLAEHATLRKIPIEHMWLRYPEPKERAAYEAYFGPNITFGAERDRMLFPSSVLQWPHLRASAQLAHVLEAHAKSIETALPDLAHGHTWLKATRQVIEKLLPDGEASITRVARELNVTPRTLQRHLEAESASLRGVVEDLRRDLATKHLANPHLSLAEVAFALGFSDQTAFHRAFVRWMGMPPGEYRRKRAT